MSDVSTQFVRLQYVIERVGLSKNTIRRLEMAGKFPRRRSLSPRSVAWLSSEIEAWIDAHR
jgi:prophage regulatory protein